MAITNNYLLDRLKTNVSKVAEAQKTGSEITTKDLVIKQPVSQPSSSSGNQGSKKSSSSKKTAGVLPTAVDMLILQKNIKDDLTTYVENKQKLETVETLVDVQTPLWPFGSNLKAEVEEKQQTLTDIMSGTIRARVREYIDVQPMANVVAIESMTDPGSKKSSILLDLLKRLATVGQANISTQRDEMLEDFSQSGGTITPGLPGLPELPGMPDILPDFNVDWKQILLFVFLAGTGLIVLSWIFKKKG